MWARMWNSFQLSWTFHIRDGMKCKIHSTTIYVSSLEFREIEFILNQDKIQASNGISNRNDLQCGMYAAAP